MEQGQRPITMFREWSGFCSVGLSVASSVFLKDMKSGIDIATLEDFKVELEKVASKKPCSEKTYRIETRCKNNYCFISCRLKHKTVSDSGKHRQIKKLNNTQKNPNMFKLRSYLLEP